MLFPFCAVRCSHGQLWLQWPSITAGGPGEHERLPTKHGLTNHKTARPPWARAHGRAACPTLWLFRKELQVPWPGFFFPPNCALAPGMLGSHVISANLLLVPKIEPGFCGARDREWAPNRFMSLIYPIPFPPPPGWASAHREWRMKMGQLDAPLSWDLAGVKNLAWFSQEALSRPLKMLHFSKERVA